MRLVIGRVSCHGGVNGGGEGVVGWVGGGGGWVNGCRVNGDKMMNPSLSAHIPHF